MAFRLYTVIIKKRRIETWFISDCLLFAMKTALITGAYSEIGFKVCSILASEGYRLICQYTTCPKDELLVTQKINFVSVQADFNDQKSLESFVNFVCEHADTVDVIVHCAAKHEKTILEGTSESIFDTIAHVNLFAPIFITEKFVDKMKTSDNPIVIFISSTYAKQRGSLKNIYYASTKTALHTVSRIFARDFAPIRSNVIMPGYVDTPMYRSGREESEVEQDKQSALNRKLVPSQDIAETVLFIVKNKSINGTVIPVDGGLHL